MPDALTPRESDTVLRARLLELALNDLQGPAGGETEEISERNVRDRYLVGVLAPLHHPGSEAAQPEAGPTSDDDEDEDVPPIPDELAEGGDDSGDEGKADQDVLVSQATLPSSIGFTFCVSGEATAIRVEASWGQYLREESESLTHPDSGKALLVWRRYPRKGGVDLALKEGPIRLAALDPAAPVVVVRGRIRKRDHGWVVTLFLVNEQAVGRPKDESFVFQPRLRVSGLAGAAVFERRAFLRPRGAGADPAVALEESRLDMAYRATVEFAVGHGVAVHASASVEKPGLATSIETRVVPTTEVPRSTPPTVADADIDPAFGKLEGLVLDMKELATLEAGSVRKQLGPLVIAYKAWIDGREKALKDPASRLAGFSDAAKVTVLEARENLRRIDEGLKLLEDDAVALDAFRFLNEAMWLQRTHALYSERRRRDEDPNFEKEIDVPSNRRWYPFQIAFILLNLPALTRPDHADRSPEPSAVADLLFFPTGGGKTEAYLGLAAFTMALRRLQPPVAGRASEPGLAVLMRYTLRLLTIQQFQRATALLCACESIRRAAIGRGDRRFGETPFRIGLWVGQKTTPNRTTEAAEAVRLLRGNEESFTLAGSGSPYQLTACPWCGSRIEPGRNLQSDVFPGGSARTLTFCGDLAGQCLFGKKNAPDEGLPVVVVDEEIYRRLPSMLIATVDKFAQMPWKGEVGMLFGAVDGYCERHGFRSPEIEDSSSHPKSTTRPPAKTVPQLPLRPPDLIIQDELHLISGPLGTLVGLYETAIDELCTWEDASGRKIRPKVVASTATIRAAASQVHSLFLRKVNVFPPPGLDIGNNFFSLEREPSDDDPGRLYIGICAPGRRLKAALIRVYVAFLCAAQSLYEQEQSRIDPWMTLVGYFNSMRELGGMRRLVDDDVTTRAKKMDRRGLAKRYLVPNQSIGELTSRIRSEEIPRVLDRLEVAFDPASEKKRKEKIEKKDFKGAQRPLDVLLATNMISVGVDVPRLGLMVVAGQPKATAEYIQATSRVGRRKPGIVCTVYNWARPRDMSHYETFEHYHATFYKHVEALSVTPFSTGALKRGLAGLLVSLIRLRGTEYNPNNSAGKILTAGPVADAAIEAIARRAELVGSPRAGDECRAELKQKLDVWRAEAQNTAGGRTLTYSQPWGKDKGTSVPLLTRPSLERWMDFTCLNSLREVEPTVRLVLRDGGLDVETGHEAEAPAADAPGNGDPS
ncbi:MAG: DISARM system helicase DrmA [Thermoanaerobaculia bacterium]